VSSHPSRLAAGPLGPAAYLELGGQRQRSCLALHRVGFAWPPRRRDAGALLPHLFTLACARLSWGRAIGGVFLWHCPAAFAGSVPRPPCPAVSGLSSRGRLSPRPPRGCLAGSRSILGPLGASVDACSADHAALSAGSGPRDVAAATARVNSALVRGPPGQSPAGTPSGRTSNAPWAEIPSARAVSSSSS
jgi:hypothetical protein